MQQSLTYSIQDYLKSIYELTEAGSPASTNALADRLGVAPASVTGMIQRLAALTPRLVSYKKHQGVMLTQAGKRAALDVIRRHRLLEAWLVKELGYGWDEVHGEAETLEHAISQDLELRIARSLGNPERDPHGEPIPSEDLTMPEDGSVPLAAVRTGQEAIVRRVRAQDGATLRHLERMGLKIGARLETVDVSPYDQVVRLRIHGQREPVSVGPALTERIYVETIAKTKSTKAEVRTR